MIPIDAGPIPDLANERSWRLAWLRMRWDAEGVDGRDPRQVAAFAERHSGHLNNGYQDARAALLRRQHRKCAYCEHPLTESDPIDHHRPRRRYPPRGDALQHPGYFWLTWSPDNLLLACASCNNHKGSAYPFGGTRTQPWQLPNTSEEPDWLDPLRDDPSEHVGFRWDRTLGKWSIYWRSPRGRATVKDLHFEDHDEDWQGHVGLLSRLSRTIDRAAECEQHVAETWDDIVGATMATDQKFLALTRAWFDHRYPLAWRERHGVELPDLARRADPPDLEPLWPPRPELEVLPPDLALKVRSLGHNPPVEDTRDTLCALAAAGTWTVDALTHIFPQTAATLRIHLRACAQAGRLRFDGDEISAPDGVTAGDVGAP